jgi:hypothetical protein
MLELKKTLNRSILVGTLSSSLSFIFRIIPCKSPNSQFTLCKMPNPLEPLPPMNYLFFYISNNPLTGLVLTFFIFSILYIIISFFIKKRSKKAKKGHKIIDLTKK